MRAYDAQNSQSAQEVFAKLSLQDDQLAESLGTRKSFQRDLGSKLKGFGKNKKWRFKMADFQV